METPQSCVRPFRWSLPEPMDRSLPGVKTGGPRSGATLVRSPFAKSSPVPADANSFEGAGLDLRPSPCRGIYRLPPVGAVAREGNEAAARREAQALKQVIEALRLQPPGRPRLAPLD